MADLTIQFKFEDENASRQFKSNFKKMEELSWDSSDEETLEILSAFGETVVDFIAAEKNTKEWMKTKNLNYYLSSDETRIFSKSSPSSPGSQEIVGELEFCDLDENLMKYAKDYQGFLVELLKKLGASEINPSFEFDNEEEMEEYYENS